MFQPTFGETGVLTAIKHKASNRDGAIPAHVTISKQYSLVFNHNEHKAVCEFKPHTINVHEFFCRNQFKGHKRGGSTQGFKTVVTVCKSVLQDRESKKEVAAGSSSSTWMQVCGLSILAEVLLHYVVVCVLLCLYVAVFFFL